MGQGLRSLRDLPQHLTTRADDSHAPPVHWPRRASTPTTASTHRLRRGLPGYLILFAPHAFASQRQYRPRELPSPSVFFLISAHFTATPGIPFSSSGL